MNAIMSNKLAKLSQVLSFRLTLVSLIYKYDFTVGFKHFKIHNS